MQATARRGRRQTTGLRILVLLALTASALPVVAQEGSTSLTVRLPDVLVMRYWPQLEAAIDSSGSMQLVGRGPAVAGNAGAVDVAVSVSGAVDEPVSARLAGAFAVQSISPGGQTQVSLRIEQPRAQGLGGGEIVAVGAEAVVAGVAGPTVAFAAPGLARSVVGGVQLTLDASGAAAGGWYRGITLRLVAENL